MMKRCAIFVMLLLFSIFNLVAQSYNSNYRARGGRPTSGYSSRPAPGHSNSSRPGYSNHRPSSGHSDFNRPGHSNHRPSSGLSNYNRPGHSHHRPSSDYSNYYRPRYSNNHYHRYSNYYTPRYSNRYRPRYNTYHSQPRYYREDGGIRYQSYIYTGADFTSGMGGPSLDWSSGIRVYEYAYFGLSVGCHSLISSGSLTPYFPLTFDTKIYAPIGHEVYPHIDLKTGFWVDLTPGVGFYFRAGLGIDYRRLSFVAGYQMLELYGTGDYLNMAYLNIGVRIGR